MSRKNCDVARFRVGVVQRDVLLHREFWDVGVAVYSCRNMVSRMATVNSVLHHAKRRCHSDRGSLRSKLNGTP